MTRKSEIKFHNPFLFRALSASAFQPIKLNSKIYDSKERIRIDGFDESSGVMSGKSPSTLKAKMDNSIKSPCY